MTDLPTLKSLQKPVCECCQDELWVCENHADKPWNEKMPGGCKCGAGMPCPACNEGLQRGHGFDVVDSVVADTPIDTRDTPKLN